MPEHPVRLVVVDQQFGNALVRARNNLHQVGFNSELLGLFVPPQEVPVPAPEVQPVEAAQLAQQPQAPDPFINTVRRIENIMRESCLALYKVRCHSYSSSTNP